MPPHSKVLGLQVVRGQLWFYMMLGSTLLLSYISKPLSSGLSHRLSYSTVTDLGQLTGQALLLWTLYSSDSLVLLGSGPLELEPKSQCCSF